MRRLMLALLIVGLTAAPASAGKASVNAARNIVAYDAPCEFGGVNVDDFWTTR